VYRYCPLHKKGVPKKAGRWQGGNLAIGPDHNDERIFVTMADSNPTEFMTTREAAALAENLAGFRGRHSVATRVAALERHGRQASRLIRAMLRQVHSSDVFQLPAEE
jgi:hypothetical protein